MHGTLHIQLAAAGFGIIFSIIAATTHNTISIVIGLSSLIIAAVALLRDVISSKRDREFKRVDDNQIDILKDLADLQEAARVKQRTIDELLVSSHSKEMAITGLTMTVSKMELLLESMHNAMQTENSRCWTHRDAMESRLNAVERKE